MPIMTGFESTCAIRALESERRQAYDIQHLIRSPLLTSPSLSPPGPPYNSFPFHAPTRTSPFSTASSTLDQHLNAPRLEKNSPALIIALTGLSSKKDQEMAFEAGVDVFMTKPVRFREVGRILDGWMKSREDRDRETVLRMPAGKREKREVDEGMCGAKRSG
jgi:CheY-like chemotaxis protein